MADEFNPDAEYTPQQVATWIHHELSRSSILRSIVTQLVEEWDLDINLAQWILGQQLAMWGVTMSVRGLGQEEGMDEAEQLQLVTEIGTEFFEILQKHQVAMPHKSLKDLGDSEQFRVALQILGGVRTVAEMVKGPDDFSQDNMVHVCRSLGVYRDLIDNLFSKVLPKS